jgi:hypothetical protein
MNRFTTLMVMVFFLVLLTVVTNSLAISTGEGFISGFEGEAPGEDKMSVFSVIQTFWKIITFRVEGFPVALNLLVFMPLTFGIVYIIADILKDLVPFT